MFDFSILLQASTKDPDKRRRRTQLFAILSNNNHLVGDGADCLALCIHISTVAPPLASNVSADDAAATYFVFLSKPRRLLALLALPVTRTHTAFDLGVAHLASPGAHPCEWIVCLVLGFQILLDGRILFASFWKFRLLAQQTLAILLRRFLICF